MIRSQWIDSQSGDLYNAEAVASLKLATMTSGNARIEITLKGSAACIAITDLMPVKVATEAHRLIKSDLMKGFTVNVPFIVRQSAEPQPYTAPTAQAQPIEQIAQNAGMSVPAYLMDTQAERELMQGMADDTYPVMGHKRNFVTHPIAPRLSPVASITIHRAEGEKEGTLNDGVFAGPDAWTEAAAWLAERADSYPSDGSYDKHDYQIIWQNTRTFGGRLDCKHPDQPNNELDFVAAVRGSLEFYTGRSRPDHMTEEEYRDLVANLLQGWPERSQAILDNCQIPEVGGATNGN